MINPSLLRLTRLKLELRNLTQNISRLEREKNVSKDRISQLEKLRVKVSRDNYELISLRRRVEYLQKDINKIVVRKNNFEKEIDVLKKCCNIAITCEKIKKMFDF
jgi:DNA repair exonuclease SbcCD ATPase subunit